MKTPNRSERGFALISSLAILSILVILIVAYASTMRTERTASQNFIERERAQAIGQAVLSHIMADHAAPQVGNGRLKPFAVDSRTKLPTAETEDVYYADKPAKGIYTINPMPGLSTKNHLVRVSRPFDGGSDNSGAYDYTQDPAYTPADWAWARQKTSVTGTVGQDEKLYIPQTTDGTLIAPQWIDYYEVTPETQQDSTTENLRTPVGQVAFAIWDESGKVDINLAGEDTSVNGLAPHNLSFEKFVRPDKEAEFLAHLNGGESDPRDRNNFSLRRISEKTTENNRGNDRWFFSVEEMLGRGFFNSDKVLDVTHSSRDFDVRPEWDGDRSPENAEKFLRSYINNPRLFDLFTQPRAGSQLVSDDMTELKLRQKLSQSGFPATEDWMQVMRLLAALRKSLPPYKSMPSPALPASLPMNLWSNDDVWGIALNIMQATAPASDQNLFAFDRQKYTVSPFLDPNVRIGIRVGPYITEAALRVTRLNATQVKLEQFFEFWNPYPVELKQKASNGQLVPIKYFYGNWTGGHWDTSGNWTAGGIYSMSGSPGGTARWELGTPANPNPGPGQFVVKKLERTVEWPMGRDFEMRTRPYLQDANFWSTLRTGTGGGQEESSSYAITIAPFYSNGGGDASYNLVHFIPRAMIDRRDTTPGKFLPAWHSFQIDDPRMGPYSRYTANYKTQVLNGFQYSWQAFPNKHSLFGIAEDVTTGEVEKFQSPHGDGYNENFGANWLPGMDFQKAMATFALPQRPFLNVSELGTVFANRPWRTLSFASTIAPLDPALKPGTRVQDYPTALLDYLTTVGTTTERRDLPYRQPAPAPPNPNLRYPQGFITTNLLTRAQKPTWLFESVEETTDPVTRLKIQKPTGNLRPIRGRINLNSASKETITHLLSAPYRLVRSLGLPSGKPVDPTDPGSDLWVTLPKADAELVAAEIVGDPDKKTNSIRPIRSMADLGKLTSIAALHAKHPDSLVDAVIGRLAQFGTVRQQIYTVDIIARSLSPEVEKKRRSNSNIPRVVTGEVRFLARVYFDTFTRRGFVESIEYR